MNNIKRPFFRGLFVLLILQSLLLQVQPVFACQLMDAGGPAEDCCCGDKAPAPDTGRDGCCDFSLELWLKSADDASPPALLAAQSDRTPTAVPLARDGREVLQPAAANRQYSFHFTDPAAPGTSTYLATRRLRL